MTTTTWKKTTTTTPVPAANPSNSFLRRVSFVLLLSPSPAPLLTLFLSLSLSFSFFPSFPLAPSLSPYIASRCPPRASFFLADSRCTVHPSFSATFGALPVFLSRRTSFSAELSHLSVLLSCPADGGPRRSEVERKRSSVEVDGT